MPDTMIQEAVPRAIRDRVGAVVIGRNEGERLIGCLESLQGTVGQIVYVDSGSTDGSKAAAEAVGARVVELDLSWPFTAARARNAGIEALGADQMPEYVQFVDGDCAVQPGWIATAHAFLEAHPRAAVVCGRRRERDPGASVYNRLCDDEWDTPVGRTRACGGDALMRARAFTACGGFNPVMIAGEEPELCVRLRLAGWEIWRVDHEMTLHDAAMHRLAQWWTRTRRSGHAFAEGAAMHGHRPGHHNVAGTLRALTWGLLLPVAVVLTAWIVTPWALLTLLAYPAQVLRLALRHGGTKRFSWERAFFMTLGKVPEAQGVLRYALGRLRGRPSGLIEYK